MTVTETQHEVQLTENAQKLLCNRYLSRLPHRLPSVACDYCSEYHETVESMFERVSFGNIEYYDLMKNLEFLPNSPTLFNAGLNNGGTFSACFKFDIADNMLEAGGIIDVARKATAVMKHGGGVGFALGEVRAKGVTIASTHGKACGPVEVIRYLHAGARMITQGGKRDAAQMAILPWDHGDILEFIGMKNEHPEELYSFNLSVALDDKVMEEASHEYISEGRTLLAQMAQNAWRTGDPGVFFREVAERANPTPWLGKLTGTNPCGEVPLLDNEPCNLGSINLTKVLRRHETKFETIVDYEELKRIVRSAIRFLDDILDHNTFPTPEIDAAARKTRKLGLGVMGWADVLQTMEIHYDSKEALNLASKIMRTINETAHEESAILADEKGICPALKQHPSFIPGEDVHNLNLPWIRRNATLTCIAPTGSIGIIAGVSSGIEPHYSLSNTRTMGDGTVLQERVNVTQFAPHIAEDIHPDYHIKMQAAFQEHVDLAVSKTINMPNEVNEQEIFDAFLLMWSTGCKGGTIYRDGSRENQVLQSDDGMKDKVKSEHTHEYHDEYPKKVPNNSTSLRHAFVLDGVEMYFHIGTDELGKPLEIFITASDDGDTLSGFSDSLAILMSLALQHGVPTDKIIKNMRNRRFEPAGITDNPEIPMATSLADYAARFLDLHYTEKDVVQPPQLTGMLCPECGSRAIRQENCLVCSKDCGWSRC